MKHVTRVVFLSSLLCTAGCAFGTRHAEMGYPPVSEDRGMIPAAHAASVPVGRSRDVILTVSDGRTETHRIGNVRNGFGMDTANVVTEDNLVSWVEGAFTHELTSVGYSVTPEGGDVSHEDAIGITAEILEVYCDAYMTYDGDVSLMVTLEGQGHEPVRKQYAGEGSVGMSWAATSKSYAESLALALEHAIAQVMVDLERLVE